ncbi:Nitroimidazol reductase NimA, pyridoxamine 5'-phosphate oxidase superfamily [Streptomyces sp. 2323.1]|uniref:pyridoxamine 5'-phosphate oxidase family protein n=1 Tax=Streptomyces sp. 2323.1 TaxID=1938841 RepID=UPI000BB9739A|nr:pyridoxamine 5'-phosphate oxidase family protein [Streptomyces sp. 2323.1]SOE15647.1 Nitroimidazol reductase NimA, pyridoxamine 5'-phosphate oxidase superfamily [Streptomyces sp. 2323.1]
MTSPSPGRTLSETERTRHRRLREQGSLDRAALDAVLAAGFLCHLGVLVDGSPMVVPTVYGADGSTLYFHGSVASRSLIASPGANVCVTVTHVDGLVLARSVFEHGVNYRSAMVFGTPRQVTDPEEKLAGLRCLTEQAAPGQWDYARRPSRKELAATALLALSLDEASVKIRTGPPDDGDGADAELGLWAGVLPLHSSWGPLEPAPALPTDLAPPAHLAERAASPAGRRGPDAAV